MDKLFRMLCIILALIAVVAVAVACAVGSRIYADETQDELTEEEKARQELLDKTYKIKVASNHIKGWPKGPAGTYGEAACVMDIDSGTVLYNKKMDTQQYPASITKIMTALVVCKYGSLDSKVEFCSEDVEFLEPGDASIGMNPGEIITMEEAMYAMLLNSANEVSHAIIRVVGHEVRTGGEIDVPGAPQKAENDHELDYQWGIALMNMEAKELGCTNSHFVNSYGLHDKKHYVSAHDMCLIGAAVYKYEEFRKVTQTLSYVIPKHKKKKKKKTGLYTIEERWLIQNHKMLHPDHQYYYDCVTGGKTGFTDQAGTTLVTFAEKNGRRLVCTCLHTYGAENVYNDTRAMIDYGFNSFTNYDLSFEDRSAFVGKCAEEMGTGRNMTIEGGDDMAVTCPNKAKKSQIEGNFIFNRNADDINAGRIELTLKGLKVGSFNVQLESYKDAASRALAIYRRTKAKEREQGQIS